MPAIGATVRSRWVAVRVSGSRIFDFAGAWAMPMLALVFYILTILYALRSKAVSSVSIFGGSPNYPLRTLSGLSIFTTHILLAATIFQSFNSLRLWRIVGRGLAYHEDLALQGESSKKGLLALLFGCKTANWRARLWSTLRLVAMVLPSVLNFLLMTDVQAVTVYTPLTANAPIIGISTQTFNATLAQIYHVATDLVFSGDFSDFVSNANAHNVDLTSDADMAGCNVDWRQTGSRPCTQTYYLPGSIEPSVPDLLNSTFLSSSNMLLVEKQLGSIHQYTDGDPNWVFNETSDCSVYGFEQFAIGICFADEEKNEIRAHLAVCPQDLSASGTCLKDTSWVTTPGWRTKLAVSYRRAYVVYTWADGKVLNATFPDEDIQAPQILASDVHTAFDYFLRPGNASSEIGAAFADLGLGSGTPMTPLYVAMYFYEFGGLSKASESGKRSVQTALQSLVSIPIHTCQAGSASQVVGLSNITIPLANYIEAMLPSVSPDSRVMPVARSYAITVGRDALVAFAAINGIALCLCFLVLAMSYFTVKNLRDATSLPTLWRDTRNKIEGLEQQPVADESPHQLADEELGDKLSRTRDWKVSYV